MLHCTITFTGTKMAMMLLAGERVRLKSLQVMREKLERIH